MLKRLLLQWARKWGFMWGVDRLYFLFNRLRFQNQNQKFQRAHPAVKLPPAYMLYEAYKLNYKEYIEDGRQTAAWVIEQLSAFTGLSGKTIFEWGCGPARIVRHLPSLLPHSKIAASDYNQETIQWCRQNIPGVEFKHNQLSPPLPFADASFDAAYALSVLTHLSAANHENWIHELYRVLRPGGSLLLTTQGKVFENKLTAAEQQHFSNGQLVVRANVKEGHRAFSAFQSESFMRDLFYNRFQVLKFTPGQIKDWGPEQDTWILCKL
jgi:SAM-dependent methyltransferase